MRGNVKQVIGREGAGNDFVIALCGEFKWAWWRFRPTSTPPLDAFVFPVIVLI